MRPAHGPEAMCLKQAAKSSNRSKQSTLAIKTIKAGNSFKPSMQSKLAIKASNQRTTLAIKATNQSNQSTQASEASQHPPSVFLSSS